MEAFGPHVFIDASSSLARKVAHSGGIPCVTPTRPVYSAKHQRYLGPQDFLQAQGIFPGSYKPEVYTRMCTEPGLGQSLAGNSFSATVCQTVVLASTVSCPDLWAEIDSPEKVSLSHISKQASTPSEQQPAHGTILRRLPGKRKAPEYDFALRGASGKPLPAQRAGTKRRRYIRKKLGVDGRKLAKGKKPMVSIWAKMEMLLGAI